MDEKGNAIKQRKTISIIIENALALHFAYTAVQLFSGIYD